MSIHRKSVFIIAIDQFFLPPPRFRWGLSFSVLINYDVVMIKKLFNHRHARHWDQREKMSKLERLKICAFCRKHFEKYHQKPVIREGQYWLVSENDWPYHGSRLHLLFIYKKHCQEMSEISPTGVVELINQVRWAKKKFKIKGGSFLIRFGDTDYNGATVSHLHGHLISGGRRQRKSKSLFAKIGYKK